MRTLRFLLRKEFLQIRRDRAMLRLLIVMPAIQLLILSSAATFEVRGTRMYLVDEDHTTVSRGLVQRMVASGRFELAGASPSAALADDRLLDRDVSTILHVPAGFERDLVRTGHGTVQLVFNAEDGAAAGVLRSYASRILAAYGAELGRELRPTFRTVGDADAPAPGVPRIDVRTRGWYNAELDYTHYMVPGILVVLVTMIATAIGSMNIVREKEIGTLEQMNVTPVTRAQFIASKLLPFWLIALADLAVGLLLARFVFHVPMRGSLLLVFFAATIYLAAALGIGLWVSTVAETQQQAMFLSFAINMVYLLMSGLFTPIHSMPGWAQWIAELSPVKHFIVIMRSVLVRGADLSDIRVPLGVLTVYGAVVLTLAVRQYSKTTA
ncbi:ABC transporter permease [Longimicrobium sp.]|uniref:ABC transporter permease n=1 Tax=Longimicrobium sp. TaxID=2029185 RepID=UPI002E30AD7A|nr:ABC transporter permease [Longimicrobium sp.]HEX6040996.1 ABC transporter permease [Longimicrobium sp.]